MVGHINDWAIVVIWTYYRKYGKELIEIPESLRYQQDQWRIRKWVERSLTESEELLDPDLESRSKRPRVKRIPSMKPMPRLRLENLTEYDPVYFEAAGGSLCKGKVRINDAFLKQLLVSDVFSLDNDSVHMNATNVYVRYESVRVEPPAPPRTADPASQYPTDPHEEDEESENEEVAQPSAKRVSRSSLEPMTDILSLLPCPQPTSESETVVAIKLTHVPCVNGILSIGAHVRCNTVDYHVQQLVFEPKKKKAFVHLIGIENPDMTLQLPAVQAELAGGEDDYMKHATPDPSTLDSDIDMCFTVFSSIKRLIGQCRGKGKIQLNGTVAIATPLTRKILGFVSGRAKEIVKYNIAMLPTERGCHATWDAILGQEWDLLREHSDPHNTKLDKIIRTVHFNEHREYFMRTVRCHITLSEGRFRNEKEYRALVRDGVLKTISHQFT